MPIYTYHCIRCDRVEEAYRSISNRHDAPECCGEKTQIHIVAPAVQPDIPGYESPVTGKWVEGKSARREDLRRTGCRPYDPEERKDAKRWHAENEKVMDAKLEASAWKAWYSMSPDKRRRMTDGC